MRRAMPAKRSTWRATDNTTATRKRRRPGTQSSNGMLVDYTRRTMLAR
jgi:hypothetical protein